jgi:predicted ABC-type ATPase
VNPNTYIIAGPNGAGKTTFAREFLPNYANCKIFVNADLIAQGMAPFSPESAAFRAGRLMLEEIAFHAARGADFGFETTLSGKGHLQVVRGLKTRGYAVHIFYLWVPNAELALSRVRDRVLHGGHNIPEDVVRRRFERSIRNFLREYRPLADSWTLYDNTGETPAIIASEEDGYLHVVETKRYNEIVERYERYD